jgi:hypothetical protein
VRRRDGLDYAVCKLYTRLGDNIGWMGSQSRSDDDPYLDGRWTSVGYPRLSGGQVPMVELEIALDDIDDGVALARVGVTCSPAGWSGGPLCWLGDQPRVVGVMKGFEENSHSGTPFRPTTKVSAEAAMVDLVKYGWSNWV